MYWFSLFSFWIYICFILYFLKIIPFNPFILFILSVTRDILILITQFNQVKLSINSITIIRIFFIISLHYIPLYYLYNTFNENTNIDLQTSTIFYLCLFIVYVIYMNYKQYNLFYIFDGTISEDRNYTRLIDYIKTRFNNSFEFIIWAIIVLYINYRILNKEY